MKINYENNFETISNFFGCDYPVIDVCHLAYNHSSKDIKIIDIIKDNIYSCVYKAKYLGEVVAVKKIKKDQLKEDIKEEKVVDEESEEDFLKEIIKFNRELENMKAFYV